MRTYFEGCNEADVRKIVSCFTPDAVHYFPPDMYDGPWRGAEKIAQGWQAAVAKLGSYWTIDRMIVDPDTDQAAMEWTHFKTKQGVVLRGAEWYFFDKQSGLITEIRAYYASPQGQEPPEAGAGRAGLPRARLRDCAASGSARLVVSQPWFHGSFSHPPALKYVNGRPRTGSGAAPLCTPHSFSIVQVLSFGNTCPSRCASAGGDVPPAPGGFQRGPSPLWRGLRVSPKSNILRVGGWG